MRRLTLCLLLLLVGCQNTSGPFAKKPGRADDPFYSIPEQEKRGRSQYTYPEDRYGPDPVSFSGGLLPPTFSDRPSPTGR
jgi:hypothetical protein